MKVIKQTVYLGRLFLIELPEWLSDVRIQGNFNCNNNLLTSLDNCPKEIGLDFYCDNNKLTSLEGCPKYVGGDFWCNNNQLTSLDGCPEHIKGDFDCSDNPLISLEGCPKQVDRDFVIDGTRFHEEDIRKVCSVGGRIFCH